MTREQAMEDLAYIRQLMSESRQVVQVSGAYFIVWGLAVGAGLLATWAQAAGLLALPLAPHAASFATWIVAILAGIGGTFWAVSREGGSAPRSPAKRLIGLIWMSVGIGMLLFFFVGVGSGTVQGGLMPAVSSLFVGIGVFLMGTLAGLDWVRNTAFGWWLGGAVMLASPGLWNLWFMGLLLLALYLVPGILLSRASQAE